MFGLSAEKDGAAMTEEEENVSELCLREKIRSSVLGVGGRSDNQVAGGTSRECWGEGQAKNWALKCSQIKKKQQTEKR